MKIPSNIRFASIVAGIFGIFVALSIFTSNQEPEVFIYGLILVFPLFFFLLALVAFRHVVTYRPSWLQLIITVGVSAGIVTGLKIFNPVSAGGIGNFMSLIESLCSLFTSIFMIMTIMGVLQMAAKGYLSWWNSSHGEQGNPVS